MVTVLLALIVSGTGSAASSFADPAFQQQWQQGEAITPNFWGPLTTAKDGQQEPYKEATGGQRLVQYFDKGRMELTNGTVTNGLLASEIIKAQVQVGDATFQPKDPPPIPIAGDPDNPGPTYAGIKGKGAPLLAPATSQVGAPTTSTVAADGTVTNGSAASDTATTIAAFDDATKHNIPSVFVTYRNKAGLLTIGLAISEPFLATVKVAGQQKQVMIQVFERRVLTYTASNDPAFQVEMGNIGQHYFRWRTMTTPDASNAPASPSPTVAPTTAPPAASASPTPTSTPTTGVTVTFVAAPNAHPKSQTYVTIKTTPGAVCTLDYRLPGATSSSREGKATTADASGMVTWYFGAGGDDNNPASKGQGLETVTCNGATATQTITIG